MRMKEGLALERAGVSPYSGDVFHETPLMLKFVDAVDCALGADRVWMSFVVADLLTALVLARICTELINYFMTRQDAEQNTYVEYLTVSIYQFCVFL